MWGSEALQGNYGIRIGLNNLSMYQKQSDDTNPHVSTKKSIARKSIHKFSETLDVKHKTAVLRFCAAKAKRKAIKKYNVFWSNIAKRRGHTKMNKKVRESLYHWILNYPQVLLSPIADYCLYVSFDGNYEFFCQSCHWNFLCKNFIIARWFLRKKVGLKKQGTKKMILSSLYCSWSQVEPTSTWNPHTSFTHGKVKTETYPRIASGRQHGGHKITT